MADWQEVYEKHAEEYELLVSREDYAQNLPQALDRICVLKDTDVVELGAGTGRFTRMLAPSVSRIVAFDASQHMLQVAQANMARSSGNDWLYAVALHRRLPVPSCCADVAIAGWTLGHLSEWYPQEWSAHVESALGEMMRALRPGGTAIIVETLGTGFATPNPPAHLTPYYTYLEQTRGFRFTWIRTDYQFESPAEAEHFCGFFFGEDLGNQVRSSASQFVPECTGIWWRSV